MRVGRRARRAAARMRCAQRAVDTRRRRCSARGTQRASTTPSPGARGAPRTHAEAPVTLLPPGAAAERGAAGGARAARLRAVAGQQVHGAAAGLVAAQRGVVLQPVARAVHLHRQPRAEAGRVARGQRVAHLHARRQALPRVLRLLPPPGARPRPLSPPAPARRASRGAALACRGRGGSARPSGAAAPRPAGRRAGTRLDPSNGRSAESSTAVRCSCTKRCRPWKGSLSTPPRAYELATCAPRIGLD